MNKKYILAIGTFLIFSKSFAMRYTDLVITDEPPQNQKQMSVKDLESYANYTNNVEGLGLGKSSDIGLAATLIHPRVAITAAHCVRNEGPGDEDYASKLIGRTMTFYGQTVKIISVNPKANSGIDNSDIALIEFDEPITAGPPVKLYKGDRSALEDQWLLALSYGPICFGANDTPASNGGVLHMTRTHYRKYHPNRTVIDTYGRSEGFQNTTQYPDNDPSNKFRGVGIGADSGSPLYCRIEGKYQLVGICSSVSHGYLEVPDNMDKARAGYINLNDEYESFIKPNTGEI